MCYLLRIQQYPVNTTYNSLDEVKYDEGGGGDVIVTRKIRLFQIKNLLCIIVLDWDLQM